MNAEQRTKRECFLWVCSLAPCALLVTTLTMAIHIRLVLGRWPRFGENYDGFFFQLHQTVWGVLVLFAASVAGPLWLILSFRSNLPARTKAIHVLAFAFGWLLIIIGHRFDPTPFTYWLLD